MSVILLHQYKVKAIIHSGTGCFGDIITIDVGPMYIVYNS